MEIMNYEFIVGNIYPRNWWFIYLSESCKCLFVFCYKDGLIFINYNDKVAYVVPLRVENKYFNANTIVPKWRRLELVLRLLQIQISSSPFHLQPSHFSNLSKWPLYGQKGHRVWNTGQESQALEEHIGSTHNNKVSLGRMSFLQMSSWFTEPQIGP